MLGYQNPPKVSEYDVEVKVNRFFGLGHIVVAWGYEHSSQLDWFRNSNVVGEVSILGWQLYDLTTHGGTHVTWLNSNGNNNSRW